MKATLAAAVLLPGALARMPLTMPSCAAEAADDLTALLQTEVAVRQGLATEVAGQAAKAKKVYLVEQIKRLSDKKAHAKEDDFMAKMLGPGTGVDPPRQPAPPRQQARAEAPAPRPRLGNASSLAQLSSEEGNASSLAQLSSEEGAGAALARLIAEEASWDMPRLDKHAWLIVILCIESFVLFMTIGLPIALWALAAFLGRSIKFGIETCDRLFIGTDVTIKRLETNIFQGVIVIDGLEIENPKEGKYNSQYLLRAGLVHIDLDVTALICSFFRHIKIEKIEFKNVDVIYEKGWTSSNVQDVLAFLKGRGRDPGGAEGQEGDSEGKETAASTTQITLHEVVVEDVGARLQAQVLGDRGCRVSVGDIVYKDFAEEVGESTAGPIIQVLLKSVLKTVIVNAVGKQVGERCMSARGRRGWPRA